MILPIFIVTQYIHTQIENEHSFGLFYSTYYEYSVLPLYILSDVRPTTNVKSNKGNK